MYWEAPKQIPWDGKLKYDYQLWIDSDIVFDTNKFWQLIDLATKDAEVTQEVKDKDGKVVSTALGVDDSKVRRLLLVGMQQRTVTPLPLHIG